MTENLHNQVKHADLIDKIPTPRVWHWDQAWNAGEICNYIDDQDRYYIAVQDIPSQGPPDTPQKHPTPPFDSRWQRILFDPQTEKIKRLIEVVDDLTCALETLIEHYYGSERRGSTEDIAKHPRHIVKKAKQKMEGVKQL